jgi:hypothetical protein
VSHPINNEPFDQYSCNRQDHLILQTDGNLVLYEIQPNMTYTLWESGTVGAADPHFIVQKNGELDLVDYNNNLVWYVNSQGNPNSYLDVQDNGNLVLYSASNQVVWATNTENNPLLPSCGLFKAGETLTMQATDTLGPEIDSCKGRDYLTLQTDGNLVLYEASGTPLWSSTTSDSVTAQLVLQSDGNLVLYGDAQNSQWASNTSGNPNDYLVVQDDGNLVLYSDSDTVLWATNTTNSG